MTAPQTLAEAWSAHCDRVLPIDCSAEQVRREKREFFHAALLRLKAIENRTAEQEAQFQEALGFARTIGRAVETAS